MATGCQPVRDVRRAHRSRDESRGLPMVGRTSWSAPGLLTRLFAATHGGAGTPRADQEVRPTFRMHARATFESAADCQSASVTYVVQNIRGIQRAVRRPIGNRPQVGNLPHIGNQFFMRLCGPQALENRPLKTDGLSYR